MRVRAGTCPGSPGCTDFPVLMAPLIYPNLPACLSTQSTRRCPRRGYLPRAPDRHGALDVRERPEAPSVEQGEQVLQLLSFGVTRPNGLEVPNRHRISQPRETHPGHRTPRVAMPTVGAPCHGRQVPRVRWISREANRGPGPGAEHGSRSFCSPWRSPCRPDAGAGAGRRRRCRVGRRVLEVEPLELEPPAHRVVGGERERLRRSTTAVPRTSGRSRRTSYAGPRMKGRRTADLVLPVAELGVGRLHQVEARRLGHREERRRRHRPRTGSRRRRPRPSRSGRGPRPATSSLSNGNFAPGPTPTVSAASTGAAASSAQRRTSQPRATALVDEGRHGRRRSRPGRCTRRGPAERARTPSGRAAGSWPEPRARSPSPPSRVGSSPARRRYLRARRRFSVHADTVASRGRPGGTPRRTCGPATRGGRGTATAAGRTGFRRTPRAVHRTASAQSPALRW